MIRIRELKHIIMFINKNSQCVKNIKSKVLKEGVMHFFSHSCLFLPSIYNSKPKTVFKSVCLRNLYFYNLATVYDNINIIKTTVVFLYTTSVLGTFSAAS